MTLLHSWNYSYANLCMYMYLIMWKTQFVIWIESQTFPNLSVGNSNRNKWPQFILIKQPSCPCTITVHHHMTQYSSPSILLSMLLAINWCGFNELSSSLCHSCENTSTKFFICTASNKKLGQNLAIRWSSPTSYMLQMHTSCGSQI